MNTTGLTAFMMDFMLLIFEGDIQPIIFALRRTGRQVKTAGCLLETAISGTGFYFSPIRNVHYPIGARRAIFIRC